MAETEDPRELARDLFLRDDNLYGCAEATLVALQTIFAMPDPSDSSPAMALSGGVAYSGGVCGAITGAAVAVGRLAGVRLADHKQAKRVARGIIQDLVNKFETEFGSRDCADLIGYDISIPSQHDAFIASGVWRNGCMRQIEFAVAHLGELVDEDAWNQAVRHLS